MRAGACPAPACGTAAPRLPLPPSLPLRELLERSLCYEGVVIEGGAKQRSLSARWRINRVTSKECFFCSAHALCRWNLTLEEACTRLRANDPTLKFLE